MSRRLAPGAIRARVNAEFRPPFEAEAIDGERIRGDDAVRFAAPRGRQAPGPPRAVAVTPSFPMESVADCRCGRCAS
jgi:hypothetical protein